MTRAAPTAAIAVALLGILASPARAHAEVFFDARVVAIFDGDTIEVLRPAPEPGAPPERVRIRLAGIDTPERGQPWYRRARRALVARVAGREVRINAVTTDTFGRTVGEVYADGVCVGCELVREGHAWVFRRFSDDPVLLELEAEARQARRGLWGLPEAQRVPPWRWREAEARRKAGDPDGRDPPAGGPAPDRACGAKRLCGQMASCAEARHHLRQCGVTSLDRDGDGIPCESLCRGER